jgi:hypothetical protein
MPATARLHCAEVFLLLAPGIAVWLFGRRLPWRAAAKGLAAARYWLLGLLLKQAHYQARPARLVAGAEAMPVVAVKKLVKQ